MEGGILYWVEAICGWLGGSVFMFGVAVLVVVATVLWITKDRDRAGVGLKLGGTTFLVGAAMFGTAMLLSLRRS